MPNTPTILVVEPNDESRVLLHTAVSRYGRVESFSSFESARPRVVAGEFDLLITNIRLGAFNGLHLVYLSRSLGIDARTIAYSDVPGNSLAPEAHAAGAVYCVLDHLRVSLGDYLLGHPVSAHEGSRQTQLRTLPFAASQ